MKRLLLLLAFFVSGMTVSSAQMADGSVCPDFTVTGLDGNEYQLYDLLDQGYSVVVDLFAVWCGPCWNYHQGHILEDVWEQYGPNGTQEIFVITVEADASTSIESITTAGLDNSLGDWTEGITYPIADNTEIGGLLELAYYPTIYHICSNRILTEAGQLPSAAAFAELGGACQVAAGANNAGLIAYEGFEGNICGEVAYNPTVVLQNLGTETMTSATIELDVNGTVVETMEWTGELNTYQTQDVSFATTLSGASEVNFIVSNVNGMMDEDADNNRISRVFEEAMTVEEYRFTVEILTDNYGDETFWAFIDGAGAIVAQGGNPNAAFANAGAGYPAAHPDAYGANESVTVEVELPHPGDCYEFYVADGYGDGMCCQYGNGFYKVTDANGDILAEGGEFAATAGVSFEKLETVSNEEVVIANEVDVFPNPATDFVNISFALETATDLNVSIVNTMGQTVRSLGVTSYNTGVNNVTLNTTDLATGMYMLTIQSVEGTTSHKFTVNK